jgi:hypothetical protein
MSTYLIVADRLAWSMGLARSLQTMGLRDRSAEFVVVVPADPSYQADESEALLLAREAAARARTSLTLEGMIVLEALAGPAPPRKALEQEMVRGSRSYDGIVVGTSRRNPDLQIQPDLVKQLERRHGIPVRVINVQGKMTTA